MLPIGTDAEFTCIATANDVSRLEFFFRRRDGESLASNVRRTQAEGATIDLLTTMHITGITEDNAGLYECNVRNFMAEQGGSSVSLASVSFTISISSKSEYYIL